MASGGITGEPVQTARIGSYMRSTGGGKRSNTVTQRTTSGGGSTTQRKTQTNKFQIVPADPADIDDTGEAMPEPKTKPDFTYLSPGQQKVVQDIQAGADKDFGIGFYD